MDMDLVDVIKRIPIEMMRLGWTTEQGRQHLIRTYGKRSRSQLTDEELLEFLHYLESLPSPTSDSSRSEHWKNVKTDEYL